MMTAAVTAYTALTKYVHLNFSYKNVKHIKALCSCLVAYSNNGDAAETDG
jgi:hypothetical protein